MMQEGTGKIIAFLVLNGLHHDYRRVAGGTKWTIAVADPLSSQYKFQELAQPFFLTASEGGDFNPIVRPADHGTDGDGHNVNQQVLFGVVESRILQFCKVLDQPNRRALWHSSPTQR